MTSQEIKDAIKEKEYNQPMLAEKYGCSQTAIHLVINKTSTSVDLMQFIADIIGETFFKVWEIEKSSITKKARKSSKNLV